MTDDVVLEENEDTEQPETNFRVVLFAMYPEDDPLQVLMTKEDYGLLKDYEPTHGYAVCDVLHELHLDGATDECLEALTNLAEENPDVFDAE